MRQTNHLLYQLLLFIFFCLLQPSLAMAKMSVVAFTKAGDPGAVEAESAAENILRNLDRYDVVPLTAARLKLQWPVDQSFAATDEAQALSLAQQLAVDCLIWLEGWSEDRLTFSAKLISLQGKPSRRAIGRFAMTADDSLRPDLIKGVVVALLEGKREVPFAAEVTCSEVVGKPKWGTWPAAQNEKEWQSAFLLLSISEKGEIDDCWLLGTSWPDYGKRAMEVAPRYRLLPASNGLVAVASYGIISCYSRLKTRKPTHRPGLNKIWGQVFVETLSP